MSFDADNNQWNSRKDNPDLNLFINEEFESSLNQALDSIVNENPFFDQETINRSNDKVGNESISLHDIEQADQNKPSFESDIDGSAPLIRDDKLPKKQSWGLSNFFSRRNSICLPLHENDSSVVKTERSIAVGTPHLQYCFNGISNAKYNAFTFFPVILYEQFKFFFNLYFTLVALSQAIPQLRIGYLSSYVVPLLFVLIVTMSKEAMDDIQRRRRDREQNNEPYEVLSSPSPVLSKNLKCGHLVRLHKGMRVPADMVLVQSSESTGESFIKTDQLDGETDWKLRIVSPVTQSLPMTELQNVAITASAPSKSIHSFLGRLTYNGQSYGLTIDNTMWCNTVLASGSAIGCIIYTGKDTRQSMNTTQPKLKTGLLELEINSLSKILCVCVFALSVILVLFQGIADDWYVDIMRFLILFSTIIPVSLRVNLDLGKSVHAHQIETDSSIPETVVRTSTIPEDLGRIEYLLSDKTGTLTQNDMEMKKLHLGTVSYAGDTMDIISDHVKGLNNAKTSRKDLGMRIRDLVTTLAICHNVTPTIEDGVLSYQAASPDEIAIVKFTESVGLILIKRDRHSISLRHESTGETLDYEILQMFPFNSDSKRMGIIVRDQQREEIWFMQKGADTVMRTIVHQNDWLDEETSNMAREGLRTLVIARKKLTDHGYEIFKKKYEEASLLMVNRDQNMAKVISTHLESDLELLGLTGVEDKLQRDVKASVELLRNAGVKIWMLTGDKVETAKCVAISARLVSRGQYVHTVTKLSRMDTALQSIEYLKSNQSVALLIDGESLGIFLQYYQQEFFDIVIHLPAVIACRCTPQQKADIAILLRDRTHKRVCCIGDGGNDVSMIQCADVGVGIVGKEGKQASLAADFSITQFCHLTKLLLWHGRNSYKTSAKLAQFVIHRGLIISVCQAVYSICSSFEPLALYQGWLMVGYATVYTMAPVFSLVLDRDVDEALANLYPELYKELTEAKSLSYRTFFIWTLVSLYQGCAIQFLSQFFCGLGTDDFTTLVTLSFTSLVINELVMVAIAINTWNKVMFITLLVTFAIYILSVPFLGEYFNLDYTTSGKFFYQTLIILVISLMPIWSVKVINRKLRPPNYAKVQLS
ncbi:Putative aminophospholipid-translocase [Komagataella phaffii CBS 7435]|uniref:Phospholipid-transporting ATPase n=2 Tax=Komagataella phaffii TaxID=460519 RepID=C4QXU5_KOMPG|nr:Putative aminophospholipid translocase (flippase) involved in endocytosis and vacuolar biogenesis [Komagataella phaffii GS115]AOA61401.1 GQ67_01942T0 [Komagataella phaffii]CAH2446886.1 Putative aminophospholipid-translocase [Komagataella phaffii CBS 7435]AOA66590.1 GQ68_01957T0 [Komagataella phaffii GS115]CAY68068.1 Putative aminophospholipid translocase (flippase) involved in endocytosis and vacuolar biogenesis [Komagataella phaffii GS115]CCA37144.1 Putative aminophospholipid-translocase [